VLAQFPEVHVTGGHIAGGTCHGDLWFLEISILKAYGAKHRAGGRAVGAVNNDG
jgi:hypothetical protein